MAKEPVEWIPKMEIAFLKKMLDDYDFVLLLPKCNACIEFAFTQKLANRRGVILRGEDARQVMSLYSLYEFSNKLIVGSFDEPCGRKLSNLVDSGIANEDELIDAVILGAM